MCYGLVYGCCVSVIKLGVDLKVFEVMLWMLGWCSTCICVDAGTMIVCAVVCIFCELLCCFCCFLLFLCLVVYFYELFNDLWSICSVCLFFSMFINFLLFNDICEVLCVYFYVFLHVFCVWWASKCIFVCFCFFFVFSLFFNSF